MNKKTFSLLVLFIASISFSGCEVFVEFGLKNSTFELYDSRIPGSPLSPNMLTLILPGYQPDNPDFRYIIKYYENDKCTGEYFAADTLQYTVEGTWSLLESDILRIDLDQFVDAEFHISKLDRSTFLLKTDANVHGLDIEPPTFPLHLYNRKLPG